MHSWRKLVLVPVLTVVAAAQENDLKRLVEGLKKSSSPEEIKKALVASPALGVVPTGSPITDNPEIRRAIENLKQQSVLPGGVKMEITPKPGRGLKGPATPDDAATAESRAAGRAPSPVPPQQTAAVAMAEARSAAEAVRAPKLVFTIVNEQQLGSVANGMSREDVESKLGKPSYVHVITGLEEGVRETLVYHLAPDQAVSVRVVAGRVESITRS